jgi:nucleotide-binding universal stress UspA family protein
MMAVESVGDAPAYCAEEMRRIVEKGGIPNPFVELSAPWAGSAEEGLALAAASPSVTGIVIGRATGSGTRGLDRLGRVARRLLRSLPAPVMVVPPDVSTSDIGRGPIVLATDLDPASVGAAHMARRLAHVLDRELLVVSVDAALYDASILAPEALVPLRAIARRSEAELREWMSAHELEGERARVVEGERVATLLATAKGSETPLVVCGSRRLGLRERIFASSTASELARMGDRAVLVVPSLEPEVD